MRGSLAVSYPTVSKKGRLRPRDPPSIWPASVPPSCIPNPPPAPRPTKRTSFVVRTTQPDELEAFREADCVSFNDIKERISLKCYNFCCPTCTSYENGKVCFQSLDLSEGVPRFLLDRGNSSIPSIPHGRKK